MKTIKNFNKILAYILDSISNFIIKVPTCKSDKNRLLIVKTDAIGDYILFRNFLEILRNSKKFKNYEITLCGNSIWRGIAEKFDKDFVDEFIWIKPKKFAKNFGYRYKTLNNIKDKNYSIVIHPVYSRNFSIGDSLIRAVNAKEKIGWNGDTNNTTKFQRKISDKFYTQLLNSNKKYLFEFYRNKEFFEKLLNKKIKIKKPYFKNIQFEKLSNCIVISLGAGARLREWSAEKFTEVVNYINIINKNHQIVLTGSKRDKESAKEIIENVRHKSKAINYAGRISLLDLIKIIKCAKLLIGNESAAIHIAAAVNTNAICISNGNHFGRFNPYPGEITNLIKYVYPEEIEKELEKGNAKDVIRKYYHGSDLNINKIDVKRVINKLKKLIK